MPWSDVEKLTVVAAYKQGVQATCPADGAVVMTDEVSYIGKGLVVGFHCPTCGGRADWTKNTDETC